MKQKAYVYEIWFHLETKQLVKFSCPADKAYLKKQGYVFVGTIPREMGE